MLLNKQERKYKRFLALQKEFNLLLEAERKLPWTEVKPYQDGWFIHIEFKDEIKRRADYPQLLTVLNLVTRRGRTRDPKMVNRLRFTKRLDQAYKLFPMENRWMYNTEYSYKDELISRSNWHYGTVAPKLGRVKPEDYDKLHPTSQKWLNKMEDGKVSYFHAYGKIYYLSSLPEGWLRMKARPAYVTHIKDIDPQLMKRQSEVDKELNELGRDFWTNSYHYTARFGNRALRAHTRAVISRLMKGEIEDFEIKKKIRNYD